MRLVFQCYSAFTFLGPAISQFLHLIRGLVKRGSTEVTFEQPGNLREEIGINVVFLWMLIA